MPLKARQGEAYNPNYQIQSRIQKCAGPNRASETQPLNVCGYHIVVSSRKDSLLADDHWKNSSKREKCKKSKLTQVKRLGAALLQATLIFASKLLV
jgi:hypothetical protein